MIEQQHIIRYIAEKRGVTLEEARELWLAMIGQDNAATLTAKRKRPRPEPLQVTHRDPKLTTR